MLSKNDIILYSEPVTIIDDTDPDYIEHYYRARVVHVPTKMHAVGRGETRSQAIDDAMDWLQQLIDQKRQR